VDDAQLRKAWFRGYRQGDVELAIARTTLRREQLQLEVEHLRARAAAMQSELTELHKRIDDQRTRAHELTAELEETRAQRDQLERELDGRVQGIIAEAEERALGIKSDGLKQVGELQLQIEKLLALRNGLSTALKRATQDVADSLDRLAAAPARAIETVPADPWSS
jgi:chromosome segregation ATPase